METRRIAGIVLLLCGVVLVIAGANAADSFADRWSNFFTGHYTDATVWYIVGGAASIVIGIMLSLGRRRA